MQSQCDAIQATLEAANGEWVPMPQLVKRSGSYNIHSRVDELRHKRGLRIECQVLPRPGTRRLASSYRIPSPV